MSANETIEEYYNRTMKLVKDANLCAKKGQEILAREQQEFLLEPLPQWMKEEVMRNKEPPIEEIFGILKDMEKLKQGFRTTMITKVPRRKSANSYRKANISNEKSHIDKVNTPKHDETINTVWERRDCITCPKSKF